MSAKEKETLKWRMVEINKAAVGDKENAPPILTPMIIGSSNCFTLFFV
jgi:hypothetical protein